MKWPRASLDAYLDLAPTTISCESDVVASRLRYALGRRKRQRKLAIEISVKEDIITLHKVAIPATILSGGK